MDDRLELNIIYNGKERNFDLDKNSSLEDIKNSISNEFNITDKDSIYIKFNDIKYEKIESSNYQVKIELLNNIKIDSKFDELTHKKDQETIEKLNNDISSLKEQIKTINIEHQNNINKLQNEYEIFQTNVTKYYEQYCSSLNEEIKKMIEELNKTKLDNKDNNDAQNNIDNEINDIYDKILDEIKELKTKNINDYNDNNPNEIIDEKNENKINFEINNINEGKLNFDINNASWEDFKNNYNMDKLTEEEKTKLKDIFYNKNRDCFQTGSILIEESYKNVKFEGMI